MLCLSFWKWVAEPFYDGHEVESFAGSQYVLDSKRESLYKLR